MQYRRSYYQLKQAYIRLGYYFDIKSRRLHRAFRKLRDEFYEDLWRKAAKNIDAEFTRYQSGYHRISRDGLTTFVNLSRVMLDNHLTLDIMGDKVLSYSLFSEKGFKVPEYRVYNINSFHEAKKLLKKHGGPLVVKPASGTGGGRGVTTGINNIKALQKATKYASRYCPTLLIEEQVEGDSYRLLYLNGNFIDAIRRESPLIYGDGKHSIKHLFHIENTNRLQQRPISALSPLIIDHDCINNLKIQNLSLRSTPQYGEAIRAKLAVNENRAANNCSVRDKVHPQIIEDGKRLAKDFGIAFAGLDLICNDISVPLSDSGGSFNEVNTTPGIHHHYLLSAPQNGIPVAELLLEYIFSQNTGIMSL